MYICVCNAITDKQIRRAARAGVTSIHQLQAELGVATNCGSSSETAAEILEEHARSGFAGEPVLYVPSPA